MDPRLPFASPRAGTAQALVDQTFQRFYDKYIAQWSDIVQRYGLEAITNALQPLNVGSSPFDVGGGAAPGRGAAPVDRGARGGGAGDGFYRGANLRGGDRSRLDNRLARIARGGRSVPGGSFQDLATGWNTDAIRAAAREARRMDRAGRSADVSVDRRGGRASGANANASGGTFTHGDIDKGTKLTVDVSGGRAVSRGNESSQLNEKPVRKKKREADYG